MDRRRRHDASSPGRRSGVAAAAVPSRRHCTSRAVDRGEALLNPPPTPHRVTFLGESTVIRSAGDPHVGTAQGSEIGYDVIAGVDRDLDDRPGDETVAWEQSLAHRG